MHNRWCRPYQQSAVQKPANNLQNRRQPTIDNANPADNLQYGNHIIVGNTDSAHNLQYINQTKTLPSNTIVWPSTVLEDRFVHVYHIGHWIFQTMILPTIRNTIPRPQREIQIPVHKLHNTTQSTSRHIDPRLFWR